MDTKATSHPEDNMNFLYRVAVVWINPLIKLASQRQLHEEDIWECPASQSVDHDIDIFWRHFDRRKHLFYALCKAHLRTVIFSGLFSLVFMGFQLVQPYVLGLLLDFLYNGNQPLYYGIIYAFALSILALLSSFSLSSSLYITRRLGASVRSGLMMATYQQALQLSSSARMSLTGIQSTNLIGIDAEKVYLGSQFFNYLWLGPLTVIAAMCLLIPDTGVFPALAAMLFLLCFMPLQTLLAEKIKSYRRLLIASTDDRVKLMDEILQYIRVIKYYGWELSFERMVAGIRRQECRQLSIYLVLSNILYELLFLSLPIATLILVTVLIFGTKSPAMDPVKIFRILAYVNVTRFPVLLFGQALRFLSDALVGLDRLNTFFQLPIVDEALIHTSSSSSSSSSSSPSLSPIHSSPTVPTEIVILNASFAWPSSSTRLCGITLRIKPTELIAVIGEVACGKSSFIQAILGEMPLLSGSCVVNGATAYCAQTPWIQNLSLRDNILFGTELDKDDNDGSTLASMYQSSLEAANLLQDLILMPHGDATEIGERGINLSGSLLIQHYLFYFVALREYRQEDRRLEWPSRELCLQLQVDKSFFLTIPSQQLTAAQGLIYL